MNTNDRRRFAFRGTSALLAGFVACASIAGEPAGCDIISAAQVSAIVGNPIGSGVSQDRNGDLAQHCSFAGGDIRVEIAVLRADSELDAARTYKSALQQTASDSSRDEPLHGVGIESRYRTTEKGSAIIARFGVHVVIVTTNAGREAVVGLVRAVGAKVTGQR